MRFLPLLASCSLAFVFIGCAGYKLGPTNELTAGAKSVQLSPFSNQTMEPRLGDAVDTAMRRQLQRDATFHLATHGNADIVVTGVVKRYDRHELSFVPKDVLTVKDYRVNATALVTARDVHSGKNIFEKELTGTTLVRVGSDLTSAERQALPLLGDDLAKKVVALLAEGSW
jgi:hypothetical protein